MARSSKRKLTKSHVERMDERLLGSVVLGAFKELMGLYWGYNGEENGK